MVYFWIIKPLIDRMQKKNKYENKEHKVEIKSFYFDEFTNYITEICSELHIKDILFDVETSRVSNAYAIVKKFQQPKIIFTDIFFEEVKNKYGDTTDYYNVVKLFIGHELIHVYFQDKPNLINRVRLGATIEILYFA